MEFVPVVAECQECGALVSNTEKHEEFHKSIREIRFTANNAVSYASSIGRSR